jgi:KUP system potassium uptake protein
VEGLEVALPELAQAVLPIGIAILTLLFVVQRWGTHQVGRLFRDHRRWPRLSPEQ